MELDNTLDTIDVAVVQLKDGTETRGQDFNPYENSLKEAWLKHQDGSVSRLESTHGGEYRALTKFNFASGFVNMQWFDKEGRKVSDDANFRDTRTTEAAKHTAQKLGLVRKA